MDAGKQSTYFRVKSHGEKLALETWATISLTFDGSKA